MKIRFCDRCGIHIDGRYHDGNITLSSPNNREKLGLSREGFVEWCDNCYWQFHEAMKFWLSGKDANIKAVTNEY